jgi:hypothetical protein
MMINRRVRVAIAYGDGRVEDRCEGPTPDGGCPRTTRNGRVACAGARILPLWGTSADGEQILVSGVAGRCPLAGLVRVAPAPWD